MQPPKLFSRFHNKTGALNSVTSIFSNVYMSSSSNKSIIAVITFKVPRKDAMKYMGELESKVQNKNIEYKLGIVDFTTTKSYYLLKTNESMKYHKDKVPILIKVNNTYVNYLILRKFIQGKRKVYYSTKDPSPLYVQFNDTWWLSIAPIYFDEKYHNLIEYDKKSDLIEFFM